MRIGVILDKSNKGWIIEKMAKRLIEELKLLGHNAELLTAANEGFDVIHWMHYLNSNYFKDAKLNSMMVTHVDEANKLVKFRSRLKSGIKPIFLSDAHADEIAEMIRSPKRFHVAYPGSDLASMREDNLRFIITSHIYPDGRKNEDYLIRLAREVNLRDCHFILCGKRWEEVAKSLERSGATVLQLSPEYGNYPEYPELLNLVRQSDIFLYTGFDEGSMGALDAYLIGKKLIVSNQGFHKKFQGANVSLFDDYSEFAQYIKSEIKAKLEIKQNQTQWSWRSFTRAHLDLWETELEKGRPIAREGLGRDESKACRESSRKIKVGKSGLFSFQGLVFIYRFFRTTVKREKLRFFGKGRKN